MEQVLPASHRPQTGARGRHRGIGRWAVLAAFVALFPGYFVYHTLVAQGMPAVLLGYSVLMAVMVLPLVALGALDRHAGAHAVWFDGLFLVFVAAIVWTTLAHHAAGASPAIANAYLGAMPQWLALYGVARLAGMDDPVFMRLCRASWLLMSAIVLANASEGAFIVAALDVAVGDRDTLATYQDFALLYLVVTLVVLAGTRSAWKSWLVVLMAGAVLFLTGARSEFLALFVGAGILAWCLSSHRLALLVLVAALSLAALSAVDIVIEQLPDNRVVDLLANRAEGSLSERSEMLRQAWRTVADHPLAGGFASYEAGEYAHNALSVWVDFGVPGLIALTLLLLLPLVDLALQFGRRSRQPRYVLVVALLGLSLLLLLAAKAFTYNLVPFALGAYAHDLARRRGGRR